MTVGGEGTPLAGLPADAVVAAFVAAGGNKAEAARELGVSYAALDSRLRRHPDLRATCLRAAGLLDGAEGKLREFGVDPDEFIVTEVTANTWGDPSDPNSQLKVRAVPRWSSVMPARDPGWARPEPPAPPADRPRLVAFFGDHHAPHHDPDLHRLAVAWLEENQPDEVVMVGDLLDYDAVSRHRANPDLSATLQECLDAGYGILLDYVRAAPSATFTLLDGNHEDRLRNAILDQLRGAWGVTRAQGPGDTERHDPVLSVPHLLRLDELRVRHVGGSGEYAGYQHKVTPHLAARHGWIASKGSGSSALKTIDKLRYSCVIGHTHRQSVVFHTAHGIDGEPKPLVGVETGTMAKVRGGLGYAIAPDWQAGFATAAVWPDGTFKIDLASYVDSRLVWRDWRRDA